MVQRTDITGSGLGRPGPGNGCRDELNGVLARHILSRHYGQFLPPSATDAGARDSCSLCLTPAPMR